MKLSANGSSLRSKIQTLNVPEYVFWSLIVFNLILVIIEWFKRIDSMIGLSDESYLYSQLLSWRSADTNLAPFAKILGAPFEWLNRSIIQYRIMGLFVVVGSAFLTFILISRVLRDRNSEKDSTYIGAICGMSVLLIPSTFRYLLLSPGYQWLIAVTSMLTFAMLFSLVGRKAVNPRTFVFSLIFCFFVLQINLYTRLTFFVIVLGALLFCFPVLKKDMRAQYLIVILGSIVFFGLTQPQIAQRWKKIISNANVIDPEGYSVFYEVADISFSVLLVTSTILMGHKLYSKFPQKKSMSGTFITYGFLSLCLLLMWVFYSRDRLAPLIFLSALLAGGNLPSLKYMSGERSKSIFLISTCFLPIVSQFGSGTRALANSNLVLITITFLIAVFNFYSRNPFKTSTKKFTLILTLVLAMQLANMQRSFETSLDHSSITKIFGEELSTSKNVSENIKRFQQSFDEAKIPYDEKILDLSLFHPGGGLILGHRVIPFGTADKAYAETFPNQVEILFRDYSRHFDGLHGLVLLALDLNANPVPKLTCMELGDWLNLQMRRNLDLNAEELNHNYKILSQLNSDVSQENLYPKDLFVMSKCRL